MFDKNIILLIIFIILIIFYFVIRLGAGKKKEIEDSKHLTTYLSGVRILIIIIAVISIVR